MKELEALLNSLITVGGKPRNEEVDFCEYKFWKFRFLKKSGQIVCMYSLRELVSLESGLWQFVCSHLLIWPNKSDWMKNADIGDDWYITTNEYYTALNHEYRLLESALIPEEELGEFLVDNIIVKWNSK